jgi:hypothetical protein
MEFTSESLPFLALYAETHFKFFSFFPSFLFQKQPEVIFDMPQRIAPGNDVPVVLICNDVDRFPAEITSVRIVVSQRDASRIVFDRKDISDYLLDHPFAGQCAVYLFHIPRDILETGSFSVNCAADIRLVSTGKTFTILNDNLKTSSKAAFTGYCASAEYPGDEHCMYGDLHVHSQYSRSHVEFGPPIAVLDAMAAACGLGFFGITDHSYDLACMQQNYLIPDPQVRLWQSLGYSLRSGIFSTTIVQGEEVSVSNVRNKIVHLGALGISEFIPGSRDGARKHVDRGKDLSIAAAAAQVTSQGGVVFAAHPGARVGFLQSVFLKRGVWNCADMGAGIDAFQAINDGFGQSWLRGLKLWKRILLSGRKMPVIAGNDSHGDFNRYRAIGFPFLSILENAERSFGGVRTGIYGNNGSRESILEAIKNGRTFITNGPFLTICTDDMNECLIFHDEVNDSLETVRVQGISSEEFGTPRILRVFRGYYLTEKETVFLVRIFNASSYTVTEKVTLDKQKGPGYLRASLECLTAEGVVTRAITSPVYF